MSLVLVTGGAGFIGSHLSDALLAAGHQVTVLDDLSTGSMENIGHLKGRPNFAYTIDAVENEPVLAELIDGCDVVFHLAAAVGVKKIVEEPVHTIETNVRGTEVVLKHANKKKKLVVIASTSEVYGKSTKFPFNENDDLCLGPTTRSRWAYACSKALDEWLALAYYHEKKVPVIIVRFFNTVGPRQVGHYGMVLPNFARQALRGEPLTVYGDGGQTRCFGHVRDAVEGVLRLLGTVEAQGEVFNVGSVGEVTILQLAELVKARAHSASEIHFVSYDEAYDEGFEDMQRRVPDVEKLARITGFRFETSLETIVDDVLEEQRQKGAAAI